jgi:hypothetical protein
LASGWKDCYRPGGVVVQLTFDRDDLRVVVTEVVAELAARLAQVDDRLGVPEKEAARLLGVNSHCLRDCRLRGEIRGAKIGKTWIYDRRELAQFIESRKCETAS